MEVRSYPKEWGKSDRRNELQMHLHKLFFLENKLLRGIEKGIIFSQGKLNSLKKSRYTSLVLDQTCVNPPHKLLVISLKFECVLAVPVVAEGTMYPMA
mmetsp:Transcript_26417/g.72644  ORF Transcript_26417/g.72644 Transcript_26417/m.72644 type:complete len:98 (-) Transcript_26417:1607-1900(-)